MNRQDLANVVNALAAAFNRPVTQALLEAYWIGLNDLAQADLARAAAAAIRTAKYMPTPADLRGLAGEMTPETRAVYAWESVQEAIAVAGYGRSVDFDDPLVNATLRNLGGWERFIERLEQEGPTWPRKDFERAYCSFARNGISADQAAPLGGEWDRLNAANGFPSKPPVRVLCGLPPHPAAITADGRRPAARLTNDAEPFGRDIGVIPR